MDFSSLVLMERDAQTDLFIRELGSYEVNESAEYITKFYCEDNVVFVFFDTKDDVEEWEYTAIFDFFSDEPFVKAGYDIESIDDEYNPTWKVTFKYEENYEKMQEKINEITTLAQNEINRVKDEICSKKNEYI